LYRLDYEKEMTDDLAKITLGKRAAENRPDDLNKALQFEHVRSYCYSQVPNDARDELVIQLDSSKNIVKYQPINIKLALQKKRKIVNVGPDDEFKKPQT
jgi:hypothetical protein